MTKEEKGFPEEQHCLIIMDAFKGQDTLEKLCSENKCKIVIVPYNLTNKFQPLNISVNKAAKAFVQSQYNNWFSDKVSVQLKKGIDLVDINITSKLSNLNLLHTFCIVNLYLYQVTKKKLLMASIVQGYQKT